MKYCPFKSNSRALVHRLVINLNSRLIAERGSRETRTIRHLPGEKQSWPPFFLALHQKYRCRTGLSPRLHPGRRQAGLLWSLIQGDLANSRVAISVDAVTSSTFLRENASGSTRLAHIGEGRRSAGRPYFLRLAGALVAKPLSQSDRSNMAIRARESA